MTEKFPYKANTLEEQLSSTIKATKFSSLSEVGGVSLFWEEPEQYPFKTNTFREYFVSVTYTFVERFRCVTCNSSISVVLKNIQYNPQHTMIANYDVQNYAETVAPNDTTVTPTSSNNAF